MVDSTTPRQIQTTQQLLAQMSELVALLAVNQAKYARVQALIAELKSCGVLEIDGALDIRRLDMRKNTAVLKHKVKAAETIIAQWGSDNALRGVSTGAAALGAVLERMQKVTSFNELVADDVIATLEGLVASARGQNSKQ